MAVKAYVLVDGEKVPLPSGEGGSSVPVLPFVVPNETDQTAAMTATCESITSLYDGLAIAFRAPYSNLASSTLDINGFGAKPIYYQNTTVSASRIAANAVVIMIYETVTAADGCWKLAYSYQADNTARQYQTTTDKEYPVICRYNNTDKTGSYETTYLRYAMAVTLNPSTGALTVPGGIKGSDGNDMFLRLAGGAMSGALNMNGNHVTNANYVYAQWYAINSNIASSTAATEVLVKQGGWIYSRTPAQLLGDMGVSYGTEDLTAGTSALATGSLYFVYE